MSLIGYNCIEQDLIKLEDVPTYAKMHTTYWEYL